MSRDNCGDFHCEFPGEGDHNHVGMQPYLRRVMTPKGKLVDGKTGETPVEESDEAK